MPGIVERNRPLMKLNRSSLLAIVVILVGLLMSADHARGDLNQLRADFLSQKYGMFIHFGYPTYPGPTPTHGTNVNRVNPVQLNTDQWAHAAKAGGMKYGVLTTKHHSGFALWDSNQSTLDIASGSWYANQPAGQGDIVKRYADSFRSRGLGVGLYYSVLDRVNGINASADSVTATNYVKAELTQLLTNYGQIDLLWTDGWDWSVGYAAVDYQQVYDHIKAISPNTLLLENNHNQNLDNTDVVVWEVPISGMPPANNTLPAEASDTIRTSGWHYQSPEKDLRSTAFLVDRGRQANNRNANYLLNVGPNPDGLIPQEEVDRLRDVGQSWFGDNLAEGKAATQSTTYSSGSLTLDASQAVDGILTGSPSGSLARTQGSDPAPWWQVDLADEYAIGEIAIFNRVDVEEGHLRDLLITIYDEQSNLVWTSDLLNPDNVLGGGVTDFTNGPEELRIDLNGVTGQYVRLSRVPTTGSTVLNLGEVQVFAIPEPTTLLLVSIGCLYAQRRRVR